MGILPMIVARSMGILPMIVARSMGILPMSPNPFGVPQCFGDSPSFVPTEFAQLSTLSKLPLWRSRSNAGHPAHGRNRFVAFGNKFRLAWGFYRDDRIGIFNFNDKADSGHVDVKYFHYALAAPRGMST